jgi:hypothetical protein
MGIDRSKPYFEVDYPRKVRITHHPSGDTCLRHPWMIGKDSITWEEKLKEFFERHSDVKELANSRGQIIGNVDDFPNQGGSFVVGDVVIMKHDEFGEYAEKIVQVIPTKQPLLDFGNFHEHYVLESGDEVYWNDGSDTWMSTSKNSISQRVRKQREGDPTETLDDLLNSSNSFRK